MFIGRTDVDTETPILGHLMRRADSFEKTLIWEGLRVEEKGTSEDDMFECNHRLNGHRFG